MKKSNMQLMLMIDGDNAQAALVPKIIDAVSEYGEIKIRRVYGDWSSPNMKQWHEVMHLHGLKPEQQFSYTVGKNAIDMALVMDTMELILSHDDIDGVCIVSSDSDFTPLATRIREKNRFVMGIGRSTTAPAFINACDEFLFIDKLSQPSSIRIEAPAPPALPAPPAPPKNLAADKPKLKKLFQEAYNQTTKKDGWAHLGAFGSILKKSAPSFSASSYGHSTLTKLLEKCPDLIEIERLPSKSGSLEAYVRPKGGDSTQPSKLKAIFWDVFAKTVQEDGWAHLGTFGSVLKSEYPDFKCSSYGSASLSKLAMKYPHFINVRGSGGKDKNPVTHIRLIKA